MSKRNADKRSLSAGCCSGLALAQPVLDAFPDDEEVALDEPLDDLAVPLLPGAQLAGRGHRLPTAGTKSQTMTIFQLISLLSLLYYVPAAPLTVSRRLMAWPLLGLPKPAAEPLSSFSFFQRLPPSRASACRPQIPTGQRVKAIFVPSAKKY